MLGIVVEMKALIDLVTLLFAYFDGPELVTGVDRGLAGEEPRRATAEQRGR